MDVGDVLEQGANALVPPGFSPSKRLKYDIAVSSTLILVIIVGVIHIAWACGYLSFVGLTGFAQADEVHAQETILKNIQISQLNTEIRQDKRQLCMAQAARNQQAVYSWGINLESTKSQLSAITHAPATVMDCDELLVGAAPN